MEIIQFLGRLHPLILHLPIGILAIAFLMEWMSRKEKFNSLAPAVGFAIMIGMWSSILAAISGYLLSWEGGYEETILARHKYLGIGTTVISVIVYFLHQRKKSKFGRKFYFPLFGMLMILIGITGHLGGSLTHGSDFLTEPFSGEKENGKVVLTDLDSAQIFQDLIQPIFKSKCVRCHNNSKLKGDLLMTSVRGLQNGGRNGKIFEAGNPKNSLFLTRVHLPLEEKKHMPPKGKKQLTNDEIALLEWWVSTGGSFEKRIGNLEQPENIKSILAKYAQSGENVFALDIPPASESTIHKLQQSGIPVKIISKEKPFVTINLRGRKDLDKNTFKQLKKVARQLIELDLSRSNMNDDLLSYLSNFPHLQKLFLQKTQIKGANFNELKDLKYLEYLNLYDTPLEDKSIESISKFTGLKNLYLWQTNISQDAITQLKNNCPNLNINAGIENKIFGSAQLKPPVIKVAKDIFKDTISVTFEMKFKGVNIFYTLDGTQPDSTSLKYSAPINLSQTAEIQAIAYKEGWYKSDISKQSIVRAKYQPAGIKLNIQPNEKYKANGPKSLINFKKGTTDFAAGEWLGYQGKHVSATLDLGKEEEVSSVSVSALEATSSYIFYPKNVEILVSKDGKEFTSIAQKSIPTTAKPLPSEMKNFVLNFPKQNAQFIKIKIQSNLKNPKWHPAPGAPCWIFIDEIMVE